MGILRSCRLGLARSGALIRFFHCLGRGKAGLGSRSGDFGLIEPPATFGKRIAAGQFRLYRFSDVLQPNNSETQAGCGEGSRASGRRFASGVSSDFQCHPCAGSRVLIPAELETDALGRKDTGQVMAQVNNWARWQENLCHV